MMNGVLQGREQDKKEVDDVRAESNVLLLGSKDESFGTYSAPVDGWNRDVRGDNDRPTATRGAMASFFDVYSAPSAPARSSCRVPGLVIISERPRVQGRSYFDNSTIRGG